MAAKHLTQCLVHQVCDRVVAHVAIADMTINFRRNRIANRQFTCRKLTVMTKDIGLNFLCVLHIE